MQARRQPDAAQIVRTATPSLGYQTGITDAEPKPRCGFRLRRTVPGKKPAFCASPKRHLFPVPVSASLPRCMDILFHRPPRGHMRGLEAVCVQKQKLCRSSDSVLCAMFFGRRPVKEGHNKDRGKGKICFLGKVVVGKGINEALLRGENFFIISITACCRYRSDRIILRRTALSGR